MLPPSKRVVKETAYSSQVNDADDLGGNPVSADLRIRLQSIGSRVRKNVTEGYTTNRFSSVPSSAGGRTFTRSVSAIPTGGSLFCSANDTLHNVFSSGAVSRPIPSLNKRERPELDDEPESDRAELSADENRHTVQYPEFATDTRMSDHHERIIKPLRKGFRQTRSLPVGALAFGGGFGDIAEATSAIAGPTNEDEDWSIEKEFSASEQDNTKSMEL